VKVLNLYAGLGGNRRLWPDDVEVTAVEYREDIAEFYAYEYIDDQVMVGDAHQYLLENFRDFDFIWASTPCPTHSRARFWSHQQRDPVYPDLKLYEEILFLRHTFKGLWVVENVKPYYEPLIAPTASLGRHLFWSNFHIEPYQATDADIHTGKRDEWQDTHGIDISGWTFQDRTDKLLRNCVHPELGLHILECARGVPGTVDQMSLLNTQDKGDSPA